MLTLHDYQKTAVAFLKGRDTCALMLDMGLGKTACALTALEERHLPALVVAPKKVAEHVWPQEQVKWRPDLSTVLAAGPAAQRLDALRNPGAITAIGRDNIKDLNELTGRRAWPWRTIIIDELSSFKSQGTRFKTMERHRWNRPHVRHIWGLTGTPATNGYLDLWSQIYLLDGGQRLYDKITKYRTRYFQAVEFSEYGHVTKWAPKPGAEDAIKERLADICLSMSGKDYLDLPDVIDSQVPVYLPPAAMNVYRRMEEDLAVELEEVFGGQSHTADNAAILTQKLTQLSAGFIYPDDREDGSPASIIHTAKQDELQAIAEGTGDNLLVAYAYQEERDIIMKRFPYARHVDEKGVIPAWDRGEVKMLIAHPAGAGHGLNLQHGGHTIVWATQPWDLELYQQFNGRLQRQGQQHPVIVHHLMGQGTIDRRIYKRLQAKETKQEDLLSYFASPI